MKQSVLFYQIDQTRIFNSNGTAGRHKSGENRMYPFDNGRKMVSFTLGHVNSVNKDERGTKKKFESPAGIKLTTIRTLVV